MPLEPKGSDDWVGSGSRCPDTSVASLPGKNLLNDEVQPTEDRYFTDGQGDVKLYLVLDGHDGPKASNFVVKHLPERILSSKLTGSQDSIPSLLQEAFILTDRLFFENMEPLLANKGVIQSDLGGRTSAEAQSLFPRYVERLQEIEDAIQGGTTATLAVIVDKSLYIANIGNCRALLCTLDGNQTLTVTQVSEDHNVKNETELSRLVSLGLSRDSLIKTGHLGIYESSRSIGDYNIKHGYSDIESLKSASKAPGISNPYITGPYSLDELPNSFLIVMSGGLCKSLMKAQGSNGYDANEVLSRMVAEELCASGSLKDVSGKILGNLLQHMEGLFREDEAFKKSCSEVNDMTLLIRNLGFPLGDPAAKPCAYVMQARPKNEQPEGILSEGESSSDVEFDSDEELSPDQLGFDPRKAANGVEAYVKFESLPLSVEYDQV